MLGGGTFTTQNKVLPGAYINFVSAARASSSLTERGIAAMPFVLDWGPAGEVFEVTADTVQAESKRLFGYDYADEKMRDIRELFRHARTVFCYRLNEGVKATNDYAMARYGGVRGNSLKTVIQANADEESKFDVSTYLGNERIDTQTVASAAELQANDFVTWKAEASLKATAGTALTGGTNGEAVTGTQYQAFLTAIEPYSFHVLGCSSVESAIISLFTAFTKRMRDDCGVKFQTVVYRSAADYEGVISVENQAQEADAGLIYWVTGAAAGCAVNACLSNMVYDGEYTPVVDRTQAQLEAGIKAGKFLFHKVGDEVRVLLDINTYISFTEEKNSDFSDNQTVRVLDQIANDIALLFNTKYYGLIPNDESGRVSLWNDIVKHHQDLESLRAIENFDPEDVVVSAGETRRAVKVSDAVTPVSAMNTLYMTVVVQ